MIGTAALEELIERVSYTYTDRKRYLDTVGKELLDWHSSYYHRPSKRLLNILKKELKKLAPDIVLAVANRGLPYGAIASHLGYETSIIEAHRVIGRHDSLKHFTGRTKEIIWYYIVLDVLENFANPKTVTRNPIETPYKVGIIEIDKVEPNKRIVIVDDIVDSGLTISTLNRFVLDSGSRNLRNIVMDAYYLYPSGTPAYPNALVLRKLL
jgi:hypoxanthine phosphoribosyltransferase